MPCGSASWVATERSRYWYPVPACTARRVITTTRVGGTNGRVYAPRAAGLRPGTSRRSLEVHTVCGCLSEQERVLILVTVVASQAGPVRPTWWSDGGVVGA